ncbi:GxxExxY protein [Luteimonas sp. BDR2-5]|uniref:GxxExxY protein n=1 Tax=Proluteimonas luteida TaxID=2878685 RepID=UPI001E4CB818|nr:GxxExxY protein [Luteimonas sp. BDR2-5]MCD9027687.1 GxxExxY protein [Luteimonas sp. BDR2-5]
MDADHGLLLHSDLTDRVLRAFYDIYNALGPGFLESVYENALVLRLRDDGIVALQQAPVAVYYRDTIVGEFRTDLAIDDRLIIEIKAVSTLTGAHEAQLLNYLKATRRPVGLLLNFGPKPQFKRRIYTSPSPAFIRVDPRQSVTKSDV